MSKMGMVPHQDCLIRGSAYTLDAADRGKRGGRAMAALALAEAAKRRFAPLEASQPGRVISHTASTVE